MHVVTLLATLFWRAYAFMEGKQVLTTFYLDCLFFMHKTSPCVNTGLSSLGIAQSLDESDADVSLVLAHHMACISKHQKN